MPLRNLSFWKKWDLSSLFPQAPAEKGIFTANLIRSDFALFTVKRFLRFAVMIYLGVQVLLTIIFVLVVLNAQFARRQIEHSFQKQFGDASPGKQAQLEIDQLHGEISNALERTKFLLSLQENRFIISDKLAGLTRTLPARTWITQLNSGSSSAKTISIQAMYAVDETNPYQLPTNDWMNALKKDPDFGRKLKRIDLIRSSQETKGNIELYSFALEAEWS